MYQRPPPPRDKGGLIIRVVPEAAVRATDAPEKGATNVAVIVLRVESKSRILEEPRPFLDDEAGRSLRDYSLPRMNGRIGGVSAVLQRNTRSQDDAKLMMLRAYIR